MSIELVPIIGKTAYRFSRALPIIAAILTVFSSSAGRAATAAKASAFDAEMAAARSSMLAEPQQAFSHAHAAANLAGKMSNGPEKDLAIISANWLSAEAMTRLKHPDQALPILRTALIQVSRVAPNSKLQGDVLKSFGRAEFAVGHVQPALADFQKAYDIYQRADQPRFQAITLQEIASIYSDARDYQHVLQYNAESLETFNQDPSLILTANNNRGFALKDLGQLDKAEVAFRKALAVAVEIQSAYLRAHILTNIAFTEAAEGKSAAAKADVYRGLALASRDPEAKGERPFLVGVLAKVAADAKDLRSAGALFDEAFLGTNLMTTSADYRDFHEIAARVYEQLGNRQKALDHLKAFKRLDDEGRSLAASTNAALVGAKFDFANQSAKIAELKAGQLRRDVLLAQSKARFGFIVISILLMTGFVVTGLISHAFFSMRRSRNKIRAVNNELQATNGALHKALKAKTEFLATTSHEIRTPLNGILGMTQVMLADRGVAADTRDRLQVVKAAGETMSALVNDLLDVAKIETGNLSVERREIDLTGLLQDVVCMWGDKARTKGLHFNLNVTDCPARVVEDGDRLRQILFNLLSNAIKFTDRGSITLSAAVRARPNGERLVITVTDTGIGVPADQLELIFESFTQVDGGISRQYGGTGLGLTICRNLATAMDGEVVVQSIVGSGSSFILDLPLTRGTAETSNQLLPPNSLSTTFLVVVEDNPLAQSLLRSVLLPKVRRLEFARGIEEIMDGALGKCDRILVDGACLGRQYGDDPIAAVGRLAHRSDRAVTALWPAPTAEEVVHLKAVGAHQVLSKPISPAELLAALEEACAGSTGAFVSESAAA